MEEKFKNLENEIREMVAEILEIDSEKVTLDARFVDDLGMDSMMALEIAVAVERKYKIKIPEESLKSIKTLKDIMALVDKFNT